MVSRILMFAGFFVLLGLIYVSNATQSTSYGSEIQKQDAEISALEVKISDLEVENARLTSLNSIRDSEVAKTMTAPTSVNYAE
jgi:cell division protein FtsL